MKKNTKKESNKYSHLSFEEREEISIGLEKGLKQCEIALLLGRNPGIISREIRRNKYVLKKWLFRLYGGRKKV